MSTNKKYTCTPNSHRKTTLGKTNQPRLPFMGKIWHCPFCVNLLGGYFEINGSNYASWSHFGLFLLT